MKYSNSLALRLFVFGSDGENAQNTRQEHKTDIFCLIHFDLSCYLLNGPLAFKSIPNISVLSADLC